MKFKISAIVAALGLASAYAAHAAVTTQPLNRFVVELRPGANTSQVVARLEANGVKVVRVIKEDGQGDVLGVAIDLRNPPNLANLRSLSSSIRSYSPDVGRRTMALTTPIPDLPDGNETIPWGITAVGSQEVAFGGGRKICIIDTGYALGHPDLQATGVTGIDRGAGPWNADGHGHGTHVAGTIAAKGGNDQGVVGVVSDGGAELFIVRAFTDSAGWSYATDLSGAMLDCAAAGANVISMSLGGDFSSPLEERVTVKLQRQGILVIAAAGNGTSSGVQSWYNSFAFPASYRSVLSVAALDNNLVRASFSQRNTAVALTAPGVNVLSTLPNAAYGTMSGTSMATPHVAGVAALVWSNHKQCGPLEIANALKKSALDLGAPGYDVDNGWGLVQAPAAMEYLARNPCR